MRNILTILKENAGFYTYLLFIIFIIYILGIIVIQPFGTYEVVESISPYMNGTITKEIPYWWFH